MSLAIVCTLVVFPAAPAAAQPGGQTTASGGCSNIAGDASGPDQRCDVEVTLFSGLSIDSFAARELQDYINKQDSGNAREQLIAGFDFAYRLRHSKTTGRQLWLYGETVHGVRSGETKCGGEDEETEICKVAELNRDDATSSDAPLAIFRKATTFEAFMGLRAELFRLRSDSAEAAGMVYVKGQLGLLTVAGRGGDAVDIHHAGIGVVLTRGALANSYVEFGYGKNALFTTHQKRFKIDGFLAIGDPEAAVKPFAQVVIDADFASGSDSIQSYFGIDVDVRNAFKRGSGSQGSSQQKKSAWSTTRSRPTGR